MSTAADLEFRLELAAFFGLEDLARQRAALFGSNLAYRYDVMDVVLHTAVQSGYDYLRHLRMDPVLNILSILQVEFLLFGET